MKILAGKDRGKAGKVLQVFVNENKRTVSHGGISVEELIVPMVQIERKAL